MSALSVKRTLEARAGLTQDSTVLSGADLAQAAMLNESSQPSVRAGLDGARLAQQGFSGVKDNFTRPNGALGGTVTSDGRKTWAVDNTGFTITSNALVYDGVADRYAVVDSGLSDFFAVRAKQSAITANGMRIILRATAASTLSAQVFRDQTANTWNLINNTGAVNVNSFVDATDLVANDVVECQIRGDNVTVLVNDVVRGILTGMAALYPSGTLQGLRGGIGNGFTVDDFYIYRLV